MNATTREKIDGELERQQALKAAGKFKETAFDKMRRGDKSGAALVLIEELLEAAEQVTRAVNDEQWDKLEEELVQSAAVAISALDGIYAAKSAATTDGFAEWFRRTFPHVPESSLAWCAARNAWNVSRNYAEWKHAAQAAECDRG